MSTSASAKERAQYKPPKPPPMIRTRGRVAIAIGKYGFGASVATCLFVQVHERSVQIFASLHNEDHRKYLKSIDVRAGSSRACAMPMTRKKKGKLKLARRAVRRIDAPALERVQGGREAGPGDPPPGPRDSWTCSTNCTIRFTQPH
jgi:hypothetical protein